jgi:acyl carrier protein
MNHSDILAQLKGIGANVFKAEGTEINETSLLEDIPGWNSLRHIMFIDTIEKKFGIQFTFEEMLELSSIKAIADKILQKQG